MSLRLTGLQLSARELEALDQRLETSAENLGIKRVFETITHERRMIVFYAHVELAHSGEGWLSFCSQSQAPIRPAKAGFFQHPAVAAAGKSAFATNKVRGQ